MSMQPANHEDLEALISGYLDGELNPEQSMEFERRLESSPEFRREYERMRDLVQATSSFRFENPPEEAWDHFLDNVYNRVERRVGWLILTLGVVALGAYGIYHFFVDAWASAYVKVLVAAPISGLAILLISVWRQRLAVARQDRYTRDVFR